MRPTTRTREVRAPSAFSHYIRNARAHRLQPGTVIPFTLRLLQAELPGYLGNVGLSIDYLYALLNYCRNEREALRQANAAAAAIPSSTALSGPSPSPPLVSVSPLPSSPSPLSETLLLSALPAATDVSQVTPGGDALSPLRDSTEVTDDSWAGLEVRVVTSICNRLLQQKDFIQASQLVNELLVTRANDAALWAVLGRVHLQVCRTHGNGLLEC